MVPNWHQLKACRKRVKKNKYGQFRARLVARGYTQILGVYFIYNYFPVVYYITLCVILLMCIVNKWGSQVKYLETTFIQKYIRRNLY